MHVVYGDTGPGNGRSAGDRSTVGKASTRSPVRPGPDGIIPTAALVDGDVVDAALLLRRAAADERGLT